MTHSDVVQFKDRHLETLRALVLLKGQVASETFSSLIEAVDNDVLARRFREIVATARTEQLELEDVLAVWGRAGKPEAPSSASAIAYRDIVNEWIGLHETAAVRTRELADAAPTPEIAARLRALSEADVRHAETLRGLL